MNYTSKVWLFTILVSPLLLLTMLAIFNSTKFSELYTALPLYGLMICVGFVLSIPTMVFFYLLNAKLTKSLIPLWKRKLFLTIFSTIGVFLTFYLYDKGFIFSTFQAFLWPTIYSLTIVFCVWILKNNEYRDDIKQNTHTSS